MKKAGIIMIAGLLILIGLDCRKKEAALSPDISSSDEALYKLGEEYLEKDVEKARLYLRQVIDSFPKSFYAQRAKLAIADSYFSKGDEGSMIIASSEYREFISLFPLSPSAAYAQYQIGMTFYKKVLKPGRDQTRTKQALVELKKVISNALLTLSEKEQLVISLYYYDELTLKEIAKVLGLTESRISQIHSKVVLGLRAKLRAYFEG